MSKSGKEILIVEDDASIATGLALNLKIEGYQATVVHDGDAALEQARGEAPDLIVLDIALPKKNGLAVLSELREEGNHVPVIVLSARGDEFDKVAALRLGADDYVTKPFALAELLARIHAVLRRAAGGTRGEIRFGEVAVDTDTRVATRGGKPVDLTPLEFDLLAYLLRNAGQVLSRDHLLRNVWGVGAGSPRTVDNFVAQLRAKLELDPDKPRHFVTVRGSGYRFDP